LFSFAYHHEVEDLHLVYETYCSKRSYEAMLFLVFCNRTW